nr:hypothetical protein CparaKRNrm1_p063 [Cryptomonas paramecium]
MHIVKQGESTFTKNNFVNTLFISFARFLLISFQIFKCILNFFKKTFDKIKQKTKHSVEFFYQNFLSKWPSETTSLLISFENFMTSKLICFFFILITIFNIKKCAVLLKNMCFDYCVSRIFYKKNFLMTIRILFFQTIIHLIFFSRILSIFQENEFNVCKIFFSYQLSVCLFLIFDSYRLSFCTKFHTKKKNVKILHVYTFKKILTYFYVQRYNQLTLPISVNYNLILLNLTKKEKMQIKFCLVNLEKKKHKFLYGKKWKNFTFMLSREIANFIDNITIESVFSGMYLERGYKKDTRLALLTNLFNQNIIYIIIIHVIYVIQKKSLNFFFYQTYEKTFLQVFLASYVVSHILTFPLLK